MKMEEWSQLGAAVQSMATIISMVIGGIWVYLRFIRQQERYPNIEFLSDINFIGLKDKWWIAEIIATVDNKGKAQHRMSEFVFDLNALYADDPVEISDEWGGQVNFPHFIKEGSFLPSPAKLFFVDPGTKAKYSYILRIPKEAKFVILHCRFKYVNRRDYAHTAEKTVEVPQSKG